MLSLYREVLRTLRGIDDPQQREEMRVWVRGEFEQQRHATDEVKVNIILITGVQFMHFGYSDDAHAIATVAAFCWFLLL